jgi:D-tyrosyl-tRNA(Tyr) deacylase
MRAVIQRVLKASVTVSDEIVGSVQKGVCVLVGISRDDTEKDMEFIARKILSMKLFENEGNPWKKSVVDCDLEVLCVSQFTLYARTDKGNKPDFHEAMGSQVSEEFYGKFLELMRKKYKAEKIQNGKFGAYMKVDIQNDGPVTIIIDSRKDKNNADDE